MRILGIFDNGGKTIDRYTVVVNEYNSASGYYDMLGLDDQGGTVFSQWSNGEYDLNDNWKNRHLGKRIAFESLNELTQRHIAERILL